MSFKFEFRIDYSKLTALLDTFLKSHSDELTSIMGQCLVLQPSPGYGGDNINTQNSNDNVIQKLPVTEEEKKQINPKVQAPSIDPATTTEEEEEETKEDQIIDNRPLIGDTLPEDPFQNLFQNPNTVNNTRFKDRK